jgi:hypothetical protein
MLVADPVESAKPNRSVASDCVGHGRFAVMRWVCAAAALAAIAFVAPACADGFEDWEATGSASTPGSKVWVDEYRATRYNRS